MFNILFSLIKRIFGTEADRTLAKLEKKVREVNALEAEISVLSDSAIKERAGLIGRKLKRTAESKEEEETGIRERILLSTSDSERNKFKKMLRDFKRENLDEGLAEIFALCREAAKRAIGLRHFDVQLMGGMVLHEGKIAEMVTGEGKTLVATLAAALNALAGEKVHVVTVNDYLAKRDREWMGPVYNFLGLTVGVIQHDMSPAERKKSYASDIVYGTNNEFGFDYLRDNMVISKEDMVQQHLGFAIVDEVDSILVDEARTPLIISGAVDETNEAYNEMRPLVSEIVRAQDKLVADLMRDFHAATKENREEDAGKSLYLIHKADPKNRDFLDIILKDRKAKSLLDKTLSLWDSKIMEKDRADFLEGLYYVFEEKTREVSFSAKGITMMREKFNMDFYLEDIETKLSELSDKDLTAEEKAAKETELIASYSEKQKKVESANQLLKAFKLFRKDVDYVVSENKIVIVDEFTGRMMPGRRFSDGIHEAIEAKERVEVQRESQTLATITLQNYFRMYDKLAGMTGTAKTEEAEFENIYLLPVVQMPTNRPLIRVNLPDRIYKTEKEKFNAVGDEVAEWYKKGRPILVGTISIEKSERLSRLLASRSIAHNVLNAKYHAKEAQIIAQAGRSGMVTIATNMAGRGTDILLGGNAEYLANDEVSRLEIEDPLEKARVLEKFREDFRKRTEEERRKVIDCGGLHIIGTERHEARRIDNQLQGRSGRQGDPGSSRFYLSLEDDLMRIFGSDRIKAIMDRLGMEEGEVIENPLVTRAVMTAQHRVESQNFEIRKHLLKYDNVMNQQREVIYSRRRKILFAEDLKEELFECLAVGIEALFINWENDPDEKVLVRSVMYKYAVNVKPEMIMGKRQLEAVEVILDMAKKSYASREAFLGPDRVRGLEKMVMLSVIDSHWKEYLREIDHLREGISWRAYGQRDPLIEFQHEAFQMFSDLMVKIDDEIAANIMKMSAMEEKYKHSIFRPEKEVFEHKGYAAIGTPASGQDDIYEEGPSGKGAAAVFPGGQRHAEVTYKRDLPKVGRNEPCPCGSGKKYKKCCGS